MENQINLNEMNAIDLESSRNDQDWYRIAGDKLWEAG